MARTFGIKTEDATAYVKEMIQIPEPNLPNEMVQILQPNVPDEMAENLPPNLPGQEIKIEDVKIEINSNSAMHWVDDGDDENDMVPNDIDLNRRWNMDPVDHLIRVNDISSKCTKCGFSDHQYIKTRNHKIMKRLHNKCIKKGLICPHCGLKFTLSVDTRQQRLNKVRHNLCPQNNSI